MDSELLSILQEAQQRRIILVPYGKRIGIWSPGVRVPQRLRRAISRNRREVLGMIQRSEALVCPNPALHETWFSKFAGRQVCDVCSRLRREIVEIDTPTRREKKRIA